jgi:hypothetical protein
MLFQKHVVVISWRSVLLVEETGVPEKIHRTAESHCRSMSTLKQYTNKQHGDIHSIGPTKPIKYVAPCMVVYNLYLVQSNYFVHR